MGRDMEERIRELREYEEKASRGSDRYPLLSARHMRLALDALPYLEALDTFEHGKQRQAQNRMGLVENATISVLSSGAAVECCFALVGLSTYGQLVMNSDDIVGAKNDAAGRFARCFLKRNTVLPLREGEDHEIIMQGAWKLYNILAIAFIEVFGTNYPWPKGAYDAVARTRNRLVHRTVSITKFVPLDNRTNIRMLEDEDCERLVGEMLRAHDTMKSCIRSLTESYRIARNEHRITPTNTDLVCDRCKQLSS